MIPLVQKRQKAVELRKKGYSYRDILAELDVAKSSLSLWLKDLPLTDEEKISLKNRKDGNISLGRIRSGAALRRRRLERESIVLEEAKIEFAKHEEESFFHIGISLYWAEGTKRFSGFQFINSSQEMIILMIRWIEKYFNIERNTLYYTLYIHKEYAFENCEKFWADLIKVPASLFKKTIYKASVRTYKKNKNYKGCFRITIPRGKNSLLKMKMWQKMLVDKYRNY